MIDNVWEWCQDGYQADYKGAPSDGSGRAGAADGLHVMRGGGGTTAGPITVKQPIGAMLLLIRGISGWAFEWWYQ